MSRPSAPARPGVLLLLLALAASTLVLPLSLPARPPAIEVIGAPCGSDDPRGVEARAVEFVAAARRSLHAALYELGLPSLAAALRQAHDRGVDVRIFLETDNRRGRRERECLSPLEGLVALRFDDRPTLMHDKFMVADDAAVWTGSVNLTWTGCHLHYNEALIVRDRGMAGAYEEEFERLFGRDADIPRRGPFAVGDARISCAFAPGPDRLRPWLDAVADAERRIEVAAFSLTRPDLVAALAARAREGLAVDVILDTRLAHGPAGRRAAALLREAGCRLRFGGPRPSPALLAWFGLPRFQDIKIHHKLLVADGRRIVTGSANLSANGFEHNDENVIVIDDAPEVAESYERLIERARKASRDDAGEPSEEAGGADPEN
jgi:phosphatidylserine/phosphatidylglycerophosphate/cardiolipin synthase-like enzyme